MKRMVVISLFGLNLMTAFAYAQPSEQTAMAMQETDKTTTADTSPTPSSLTNNAVYQSVSQTTQSINQHALIPLQTNTVSSAKTLKDDARVRLQGQIIRALGKDKYEFRDKTGTLIVEIDNQKWHGAPLIQQAQVILIGEIDRKSDNQIELEVDEVRVVADKPASLPKD